jgi:ABC-2 type transport system ATP-binding protein
LEVNDMSTILTTDNLHKRFGDVQAVRGVSLNVAEGEIFGFLGPNGAGKTTTIGMLLGLIHPTSGDVAVFGERVTPTHTAPLKQVGALVGATASTVPHLSGRQNLQLVANLHPHLSRTCIDEVLELVDLTEAAHRRVKTYSTGMRQRLGLAMALLPEPRLLVLDEPTNGMDPAGMREVRLLLQGLADEGITIFLSSHLLHEVEQICTRVAMLRQGEVVAQGAVNDLLGGEQLVVKVRVPEPTVAAAHLAGLPGVEVEPNGQTITVTGATSEDVVRQLTQQGIIPTEVTSTKRDLEHLFIELTA